jgi:hypothetical protein
MIIMFVVFFPALEDIFARWHIHFIVGKLLILTKSITRALRTVSPMSCPLLPLAHGGGLLTKTSS